MPTWDDLVEPEDDDEPYFTAPLGNDIDDVLDRARAIRDQPVVRASTLNAVAAARDKAMAEWAKANQELDRAREALSKIRRRLVDDGYAPDTPDYIRKIVDEVIPVTGFPSSGIQKEKP